MRRPVALLIDTDVWIDHELAYADSYKPARELFKAIFARDDVRMGIAAHSLKDVFFIVRNRSKAMNVKDGMAPQDAASVATAVAWAIVDHIMEVAEIVGSDSSDARIAAKQRPFHDDYEDDLVIAAAMRMNADFLVTSDQTLLKHATVATLTPADAAVWLVENDDGR